MAHIELIPPMSLFPLKPTHAPVKAYYIDDLILVHGL